MKKKIVTIIILLILCIAAGGFYYWTINNNEQPEVVEEIKEEIPEIIVEPRTSYTKYIEEYQTNYNINNDYVGKVSFPSGLIDIEFVSPRKNYQEYTIYDNYAKVITDYVSGCESGYCSGNDVYLRVDWKTMGYNLGGSVFMDYRNTLDDQNIIIYGHHYPKRLDADRVLFFTPLEKMMEEKYYEDNKYVDLYLEDEVRHYEIAYVYLFHTTGSDYNDLQYFRVNYDYDYRGNEDPGYYDSYIANMDKAQLYDTGVELTHDDNTLTLQTCLENDTTAVEVVVCKEIGRDSYTN